MTDEVQKEIDPKVLEISKNMQEKNIKINDKDGTVEVSGDPFKENLPEGVTMQMVKNVEKYNADFVAGSVDALGTAYSEALKKNPNIESVEATIKTTGRNSVDIRIEKQHTFVHNLKGEKEEVVRYGHTVASYNTVADRSKSGNLKLVRDSIAAKVQAALK